MPDSATLLTTKYYDNSGAKWTSTHNDNRFWGEYMDKFHELLPSGRILEIGCGGGRDAEELLSLGYDYLGIDPSSAMLEVAQKRNPKAEFRRIAVEDATAMSSLGDFDGFWASASLLHRPKQDIDTALQNIRNQLRPNAVGFISLKKHVDTKVDQREEIEEQGTRLFSYWKADEFAQVLRRNGFDLLLPTSEKPMSAKTVWLVFIVEKLG